MGGIPDMHSSTDSYIDFQKIFNEKSSKDVDHVRSRANALAHKFGIAEFSDEEIKKFCKNANFIDCIRFRSLEMERTTATSKGALIASEIADNNVNMFWYVVYRAALKFQVAHKRFPGETVKTPEEVARDGEELLQIASQFVQEVTGAPCAADLKNYVQEMYGKKKNFFTPKIIFFFFTPSQNSMGKWGTALNCLCDGRCLFSRSD
jgi:hypothetical protein